MRTTVAILLRVISAVTSVAAMPAVHEHVHEGASEQEQPRQGAKKVRGVLGDEVERPDRQKPA